jgi:hypothetical protein
MMPASGPYNKHGSHECEQEYITVNGRGRIRERLDIYDKSQDTDAHKAEPLRSEN